LNGRTPKVGAKMCDFKEFFNNIFFVPKMGKITGTWKRTCTKMTLIA
jgi:hypothetical protein